MTGLPFHSHFGRIRRGKKKISRAIKMPQEKDGFTTHKLRLCKNLAGSCGIIRSNRSVTLDDLIMFAIWIEANFKRHCKKMLKSVGQKMMFQEERAEKMNFNFKNSSINNLQISNGSNLMQHHSLDFDQVKTSLPGRVESCHVPLTRQSSDVAVMPLTNPPDMTIPYPSDKKNIYWWPSSRQHLMQAEKLRQKRRPQNFHEQSSQVDSVQTETIACDFYPKSGFNHLEFGDDWLFDLSNIDDGGIIDGLDTLASLPLDDNVSVLSTATGNNTCAGSEKLSEENVTTKYRSRRRICSSEVPKTKAKSSSVDQLKIRKEYEIDGKKITDNSDCLDANESKLHATRKFGNKKFNLTQPAFHLSGTDRSVRFNCNPELSRNEGPFERVETRDERSEADTGQSSQMHKLSDIGSGKIEHFALENINADQNLVEDIKNGIAESYTQRPRANNETSAICSIYKPSPATLASIRHVDNGCLLGTNEAQRDSSDLGGEEAAAPLVCEMPARSFQSTFNINKGQENAAIDYMSITNCVVTMKECHPVKKYINQAELNYGIQETTDNSCAVIKQVVV